MTELLQLIAEIEQRESSAEWDSKVVLPRLCKAVKILAGFVRGARCYCEPETGHRCERCHDLAAATEAMKGEKT